MTDPQYPYRTREEEKAAIDRLVKTNPEAVYAVASHVSKLIYDSRDAYAPNGPYIKDIWNDVEWLLSECREAAKEKFANRGDTEDEWWHEHENSEAEYDKEEAAGK